MTPVFGQNKSSPKRAIVAGRGNPDVMELDKSALTAKPMAVYAHTEIRVSLLSLGASECELF
jgi:hypothetical protein